MLYISGNFLSDNIVLAPLKMILQKIKFTNKNFFCGAFAF